MNLILVSVSVWGPVSAWYQTKSKDTFLELNWYQINYHLSILHTNFIRWLVNGLKISDCHHMNLSPSEKNIHFHINMIMSPYGMSPYEEYLYLSPFWYEIFRWWQVWILHTKRSYGDICHRMEARYENFSYLSPKKPFRWWRSDRFYHRG